MHRSIILLLGFLTFSVFAGNEYLLPMKDSRLVGSLKYYQVREGDSVAEIARRYDVGFLSVLEANPSGNALQAFNSTQSASAFERCVFPILPSLGLMVVRPGACWVLHLKRRWLLAAVPVRDGPPRPRTGPGGRRSSTVHRDPLQCLRQTFGRKEPGTWLAGLLRHTP